MNLEDRALAYAQLALDEVAADPRAFGITGSVQKFSHIQFRLSGARHWLKR